MGIPKEWEVVDGKWVPIEAVMRMRANFEELILSYTEEIRHLRGHLQMFDVFCPKADEIKHRREKYGIAL